MSLADSAPPSPAVLQYARFSRRLKAMFIDWTVSLAVIFGALMLASALRSDGASRGLGFVAIAALLLYEPVLVSMTGGTIGHYLTNLRVVDDAHGGNVSFPKAAARFVIKGVIGIYSFIAMAATRRNQAVHDLMTRSTVQVRDAARAAPGQFVGERTELSGPGMPSRGRRVGVIAAYVVLALAVTIGATLLLVEVGAVSDRCLDDDVCTRVEDGIFSATALFFFVACALAIVLGWKGWLWGARRSANAA
jgi:uncharacterized RDD family membrane protein YckC